MFRQRFELCNFGVQVTWTTAWANLDHVWDEHAEYIRDNVTDPMTKRQARELKDKQVVSCR